jgi:sigma-E factor negative regulatory protein RseC
VAIEGEKAKVQVKPQNGCSTCALKENCFTGESMPTLWALNPHGAKVGTQVVVELKPQVKILGASLIYLFPLLGLFLGYYLAERIWGGRDYPVLGAIVGLVVFFIALKFIDGLFSKKRGLQPVITSILD